MIKHSNNFHFCIFLLQSSQSAADPDPPLLVKGVDRGLGLQTYQMRTRSARLAARADASSDRDLTSDDRPIKVSSL
jgi:hypothetical protein